MAFGRIVLVLSLFVINNHLAECAEFVPAYIWGTGKLSEHVPALHKISEDSFKDTLLEYFKKDPYIIIFAEHTLSPEDFAQHDQNGDTAFPNLAGLKKNFDVSYKPYVQNPIGTVRQLDKPVTELSIGSLLKSSNVPKSNILIIDLNDAKDDEQRFHMLKRHDSDIVHIYKDIVEQHDNVLAIYTAHHTSWVAPEEIINRKSRSLLEDATTENKPVVFKTDNFLLYLTEPGNFTSESKNFTLNQGFTATSDEVQPEYYVLNLTNSVDTVTFSFSVNIKRYWFLDSVKTSDVVLYNGSNMYAPLSFSYHCGDLELKVKNQPGDKQISLSLPGFQVQFFKRNVTVNVFGDAYDCVGFTSVPIWSALFVTAIFLLIMTFGLTMMMDIKTMDRFDDAKGKTITINASE